MYSWTPWIIFGGIALLSYAVQANLKRKFATYSKVMLRSGMSGRDVAVAMLRDENVHGVEVVSTQGHLTDHYDPSSGTIRLSESVFQERNVAAAAVAAHECGHAVQHARAYAPLAMRSALVPVVSFASRWVQWVILAGILLLNVFPFLLLAGVVLFAFTTIFSLITLPVEIDASKRAIAWLRQSNIVDNGNVELAEKALRAAAYTYVVAALGSLATLVYYLMVYTNRQR
jgi:hypothetical protein bfra3_17327